MPGASNPGTMREEVGGGAFNALRNAVQRGATGALMSVRGGDAAGDAVARAIAEAGIADLSAVFLDRTTPSYTALLDREGDVVAGLADMALYELAFPKQMRRAKVREALQAADAVLCDANLPPAALQKLMPLAAGKPVFAIAISPAKVVRLVGVLSSADMPVHEPARGRGAGRLSGDEPLEAIIERLRGLGLGAGVITQGPGPVLGFDAIRRSRDRPAAPRKIADVTGAGDALAGATMVAMLRGVSLRPGIARGHGRGDAGGRERRVGPSAVGQRLCRSAGPCAAAEPRCDDRASQEAAMTPKSARPFVDVLPAVAKALAAGRPVVALESTIITHGMPYPQNSAMAANVERIIAEEGAVPATIAVIDGRIRVGLSDGEREALAVTDGAMKLSRADLAFAIAQGRTGGTTVAATMIAAHLAGIKVFATGGIGGVHKGAEDSFDISADLDELARTPVIVVSAGAKAILDIEKTLEVLETRGVPVVAYGSDVMPAFWSRQSPYAAPLRLDDPKAVAQFFATRAALGLAGGMLVANPVPADDEIPAEKMAGFIAAAQKAAVEQRVSGKAVTPFLLAKLFELTDGASLKTNIALVENNARLAARIAKAI